MRRLFALLTVCILLSGVLVIPASAESAASKVDMLCTVTSDGDCLVTMNVTLRLEAALDKLTFPLPANAKNITMNNASVSTSKSESATYVDISKISQGYVGEAAMRFEYTIPEVVKVVKINNEKKLQLDLPLLCGFDYPVESLSFTITMPTGTMSNDPSFTSIYRQSSIASDLDVNVRGSQIIGSSKAIMNDHEGVTMTMLVSEEMFPTVSPYVREGNPNFLTSLALPWPRCCTGF